ncbi:MAG TPA: hypothetical protein VF190_14170 [Rhodothermales bacterium]
MNSIANKNLQPTVENVVEAVKGSERRRAYVSPRLERHEDLPAITAVQSCDFFSTDGCS